MAPHALLVREKPRLLRFMRDCHYVELSQASFRLGSRLSRDSKAESSLLLLREEQPNVDGLHSGDASGLLALPHDFPDSDELACT